MGSFYAIYDILQLFCFDTFCIYDKSADAINLAPMLFSQYTVGARCIYDKSVDEINPAPMRFSQFQWCCPLQAIDLNSYPETLGLAMRFFAGLASSYALRMIADGLA